MTRDEFSAEFATGLRFVLQKHEREVVARVAANRPTRDLADIRALEHANKMTDAAIQQLADSVFDAIEQTQAVHA
jgi:hypothetical protein